MSENDEKIEAIEAKLTELTKTSAKLIAENKALRATIKQLTNPIEPPRTWVV